MLVMENNEIGTINYGENEHHKYGIGSNHGSYRFPLTRSRQWTVLTAVVLEKYQKFPKHRNYKQRGGKE